MILPAVEGFADALPPPLNLHQLGAVEFAALPTAALLVAGALYLWGVWRVNRLQPRHRWPMTRTLAFLAGLALTLVALESFLGVYDDVLFWDHMVQHLMLIMMAAPLLAVGCPVLLAWRATTGRAHISLTRALRSAPARFLDHPLVAFIIYAIVIPVSHLTSFYNDTLTHESLHDAEHVLFLVAGYIFWRPVVGHEPSAHRLHPGIRLAYLAFAVSVDTFVGLTLTQTTHEIFNAYIAQHRNWGPSLVTDLHLGGVIMWLGGDSLMLIAMIPVAVAWVRYEDRRAIRADAELDAYGVNLPSSLT